MNTPTFTWIVVEARNGRLVQIATIRSADKRDALASVIAKWPKLPVAVLSRSEWRDHDKQIPKGVSPTRYAKALRWLPPDEPRKPSSATPKRTRERYEKLKADYYAGKPVEIEPWLKAQFDEFRPRKEIGPLLHEVQSNHRSKPIGTHKWRPTAVDVDRCCDILEHQDDHEQETA